MTELSVSGINPPVFSKKQKTALFQMDFPSAFSRAVCYTHNRMATKPIQLRTITKRLSCLERQQTQTGS